MTRGEELLQQPSSPQSTQPHNFANHRLSQRNISPSHNITDCWEYDCRYRQSRGRLLILHVDAIIRCMLHLPVMITTFFWNLVMMEFKVTYLIRNQVKGLLFSSNNINMSDAAIVDSRYGAIIQDTTIRWREGIIKDIGERSNQYFEAQSKNQHVPFVSLGQ